MCFLVNIVKLFDNKLPVAFPRVEICGSTYIRLQIVSLLFVNWFNFVE